MRNKNTRKIIMYVLMVALTLTTVAYAALQTTLLINGNVVKKGALWNIYFTNPRVNNTTGTGESVSTSINSTHFTFQANVSKPGDSVSYAVDVKNGGTINAKVSSVTIQKPSNLETENMEMIVKYVDNTDIQVGDTLSAGQTRTIIITLKFNESATSINETSKRLNLGVTINYIQDTNNSSGNSGTGGVTSNNIITKIYGNSIQNGIPSPDNPIDVLSVGERTKNLIKLPYFSIVGNGTLEKISEINGIIDCKNNKTVLSAKINYNDVQASEVGNLVYMNITFSSGFIGNYALLYNGSDGLTIENKVLPTDIEGNITKIIMYKHNRLLSGNVEIRDVQLEIGDISTAYEPYGYKIPITVSNGTTSETRNIYLDEPLRKIGNYTDYIDLENGKVVRYVKEVSTEQLRNYYFSPRHYLTNTLLIAGQVSTERYTTGVYNNNVELCTHLPNGHQSLQASTEDREMFAFHNQVEYKQYLYIRMNSNRFTSDTNTYWQAWLDEEEAKGTPIKFYYAMLTPVEEIVSIPTITNLTGNVTYNIGTTIKPSSIDYGYRS